MVAVVVSLLRRMWVVGAGMVRRVASFVVVMVIVVETVVGGIDVASNW